jgi:single-strand selective monofunctional uracil DNA glycosylase
MSAVSRPASALAEAAEELRAAVEGLRFGPPTAFVYDPLDYAWEAHRAYLERWGGTPKRVVFLGMNPGPWGMAQTGIPFGEVAAARDWVGIEAPVRKPPREHPKRPVEGFACTRSEVSGRRLWGLFRERFGRAEAFFADHLVLNYCPLVFLEESGRNRTPDKLPAAEREPLDQACDRFLRRALDLLDPGILVGVGAYAEACLHRNSAGRHVMRILHPSPASPAANRGWAEAATAALEAAGVWKTVS